MSGTTIRSNGHRPDAEKITANGYSFFEGDLVQLINPQTDETFRILHKLRVLGVRAHYRLQNIETDQEILQLSSNLVAAYSQDKVGAEIDRPLIKRRGAKAKRKNQIAIDAYKDGDGKRLRRELGVLRAAAKKR